MRPAVFLKPAAQAFRIRPAQAEDIASLNGIIEHAIATWRLPERVQRLRAAAPRNGHQTPATIGLMAGFAVMMGWTPRRDAPI